MLNRRLCSAAHYTMKSNGHRLRRLDPVFIRNDWNRNWIMTKSLLCRKLKYLPPPAIPIALQMVSTNATKLFCCAIFSEYFWCFPRLKFSSFTKCAKFSFKSACAARDDKLHWLYVLIGFWHAREYFSSAWLYFNSIGC